MSDYDSCGPSKRIKLSDPDMSWTASQLHPSINESEALGLFENFDFRLPPSASVDANLIVGEPLHISSFDYSQWDTIKPFEATLSKPGKLNFNPKFI